MEHPISDASLERFARGASSREEGRAILAHLLRGCSLCSRKLHAFAGIGGVADAEPAATASVRSNAPQRPQRRVTVH